MRLPFEEWSIQKRFSSNVSELFQEAFICFKNGAYKASYLFSYLSFLTILKEVIIKSTKPLVTPQSRWDDIIKKLQNDDTWEKAVYEELINASSPIFNITDDLRQQVKFWKDRRNDCAHFKDNEIASHHTESFWSFIKSNLLKITITGGKESLLNKFTRHFDPTYTPPNADLAPLIKEIDESVKVSELQDFFNDLLNAIDRWGMMFYGESNISRVIEKIFINCNDRTKESLSLFLKNNKLDLKIISLYPDKVGYFNYTDQETREIWMTRIFENKSTAFSIYATLLRNSLIPIDEVEEANNRMIDKMTDYKPGDDITHLTLAANRFGDAIFEIAFRQGRLKDWFTWVNPRADLIAYYIAKYPLHEETVEIICEMYTRDRYSFWLGERLVKNFNEDTQKKNEFHAIAARRGLIIPAELT